MIPPRSPIHALLDANARWADAVDHAEPGFFRTSAQGQHPKAGSVSPVLCPPSTHLPTGPLDRMRRLARARISPHRRTPGRHLCPPQHCKVSDVKPLSVSAKTQSSAVSSTPTTIARSRCSRTPLASSASNTVTFPSTPSPPCSRSAYVVVLAGHTHCGGAAACYHAATEDATATATIPKEETPLSRWLAPLTAHVA